MMPGEPAACPTCGHADCTNRTQGSTGTCMTCERPPKGACS